MLRPVNNSLPFILLKSNFCPSGKVVGLRERAFKKSFASAKNKRVCWTYKGSRGEHNGEACENRHKILKRQQKKKEKKQYKICDWVYLRSVRAAEGR
jgi:hypothetical protein